MIDRRGGGGCYEANNLLVLLTPCVSNMAVNIYVD